MSEKYSALLLKYLSPGSAFLFVPYQDGWDKDVAGEDHQPDEGKLTLAGVLCSEVAPNRKPEDGQGISCARTDCTYKERNDHRCNENPDDSVLEEGDVCREQP